MPHIHTTSNQHDITVSAYIILHEDNKLRCLVHFHRKVEMLMQIGGHIELDETPWQSIDHEVHEESGYTLAELSVLQPNTDIAKTSGSIVHPVPFVVNTHRAGNDHFHTDLCYAFVAKTKPSSLPAEGESTDLRWLELEEIRQLVEEGTALPDVVDIYGYIIDRLDTYEMVAADSYSLAKPRTGGMTYKTQ